jgi:hypothetical protein
MSEYRDERDGTGAEPDLLRYFRLHVRAYALGTAVLVLVDLTVTGGWWFFWPVLAWGLLVLVHYLYLKSIRVDSRWAEERAGRILDKAYDLGHIEDIRRRYEGTDPPARDGRKSED